MDAVYIGSQRKVHELEKRLVITTMIEAGD